MPLTCPKCGGKRPRLSRSRGPKERLLRYAGVYPVRCDDCSERFYDSIWRFSDVFYARCPRCYRMDLGTWDLKYYTPPGAQMAMLSMGAQRLRCEACRCNFVSFRKVKERSSFRKRGRHANDPTEVSATSEADSSVEVV